MNTSDDIELPRTTRNGQARAAALQAARCEPAQPISSVSYHSEGSLLIIGAKHNALAAAEQLKAVLTCTILIPCDAEESNQRGFGREVPSGLTVVTHRLTELKGYLGHFEAIVSSDQGDANLARSLSKQRDDFDLVLDLSDTPMICSEVVPPGYYAAPGDDTQALTAALTEIPGLVGDFEKPKFFNYNSSICAHGDSGLEGCTNCLDACPTTAITSLGDSIEVNPHLCQGAGSCATVCPTGAITYGFPKASNLLNEIKRLLKAYRDNKGRQARILLYDRERGKGVVERFGHSMAECVIPYQVEELGSVGLEVWLAALAYGANHVTLLATENLPPTVSRHIEAQIRIASALLEGMGHDPQRVHLLHAHESLVETLARLRDQPELPSASFSSPDEKRTTLRMAVDHLYKLKAEPGDSVGLPEGSPFGEIHVDRGACTLCMSCVTVCPAAALIDGKDTPKLSFIEWNCVQCGLCEVACPEHAISRHPRFLYRQDDRMRPRILNEETPFCCIACGKPFATQGMMVKMREKLKNHWMFQDEQSLRRLQMCEDCRVKDLFASGGEINVHDKPPVN